MGAWGSGAFENDDAADWVHELERSESDAALRAALAPAADAGAYIEAPDGSIAIAAAEVVAAAKTTPAVNLPVEVQNWVGAWAASLTDDLVGLAQRAVARVACESELQELWEEESDPSWAAAVADLRERLDGATRQVPPAAS